MIGSLFDSLAWTLTHTHVYKIAGSMRLSGSFSPPNPHQQEYKAQSHPNQGQGGEYAHDEDRESQGINAHAGRSQT